VNESWLERHGARDPRFLSPGLQSLTPES